MNRSGSGCTKCIPCDLFPFGSCVRLAGGSARPLSLQGENYDPGLQAAAPKRPSPPPLRQKKHTPQTPAIPRVGVLRLRLPQLPALSLGSLGMSEASSASRSIRHRTSRPRGEMVSWLAGEPQSCQQLRYLALKLNIDLCPRPRRQEENDCLTTGASNNGLCKSFLPSHLLVRTFVSV